jgi:hypothetical protein
MINDFSLNKYEILSIGLGTGTFVGIILAYFTLWWILIPICFVLGGVTSLFAKEFRE